MGNANKQKRNSYGTKLLLKHAVTVTWRLLNMKPILASSSVFLSAVLFNSSICSSCNAQASVTQMATTHPLKDIDKKAFRQF